MNDFFSAVLNCSNQPPVGSKVFESSDHIRFQDDKAVSDHHPNFHRRFVIEKNISNDDGYTVTLFNLDGVHPIWGNNVQMSPKKMRIVSKRNNVIEFRGYGDDDFGNSFEDYGISVKIVGEEIDSIKLNMFDRGINIIYLKSAAALKCVPVQSILDDFYD